jgi:hypothetical protein
MQNNKVLDGVIRIRLKCLRRRVNYILNFASYVNSSLRVTYVRLCDCHSRRPSGSCSGGRRRLFRHTTDRCRTVPVSTCRSCTGKIDRNNQGGRTSVRRVVPDTATIFPRCILGTGSLQNEKKLG